MSRPRLAPGDRVVCVEPYVSRLRHRSHPNRDPVVGQTGTVLYTHSRDDWSVQFDGLPWDTVVARRQVEKVTA